VIPPAPPSNDPTPSSPPGEDVSGFFLAQTLVLIPALNESACVAETVRAWLDLGAAQVRVVDNGSDDGTAAVAVAAGAEAVFEPVRGYGAAAWRGLQDWPPQCSWVLFSSADGSDRLPASETPAWQRAVDRGADLVLGDRTALADARAQLKPAQRLGNWLCCLAIARGWGRRFRDLASLRLVRRAALDSMQLEDRGFGWNLEMQVRALELGLRLVELPVPYFPRLAGTSKISGSVGGTIQAGGAILRMLGHLWRLRRGREARMVHAFAPLHH
jgi:glycosyltransferase involved in cell wall biosynthesis